MAGRNRGALEGVVLAAALTVSACSQAPPPQASAPTPMVAPAPPSAPAVTPQTPPSSKTTTITPPSNEPVLIETGGGGEEKPNLAAAAAAERARRAGADEPTYVVTDKNLSEHSDGRLTFTDHAAGDLAEDPNIEGPAPKDEEYWRDRVRSLRTQWAAAVDEILETEGQISSLRTRFYAEDDPFVRDGQIKPAWDHAIETHERAKEDALALELDLEDALREGRRIGVPAGWLRDGIDLEPTERPYASPSREAESDQSQPREHVVGEPVIAGEEGDDGR